MLDKILEAYPEDNFLKADGFDDCIIGVDPHCEKPRLIYSVNLVINQLMSVDGLNEEDAHEHFAFNIAGGYVGEQTPVWCYDNF